MLAKIHRPMEGGKAIVVAVQQFNTFSKTEADTQVSDQDWKDLNHGPQSRISKELFLPDE